MHVDLISIQELEPPMGDVAGRQPLSFTRAVWATPIEGEEEAPARRIIHARVVPLHGPVTLRRLGVRTAPGYHKCGSTVDSDWITAFRVLVWDGERWNVRISAREVERPSDGSIRWFDLHGVSTSCAILEVRRCGIDEWWPSWNLVSSAFVLEAEAAPGLAPRNEAVLNVQDVDLSGLPRGVTAELENGSVRYRSRRLDVGFCLGRAGFSHFSLGESGNLLREAPGMFWQGPQLHPVGEPPVVASALRNRVSGTTSIDGNSVSYELAAADQHYALTWEVFEDRLVLHAERSAARDRRALRSSAWQLGLDCRATPGHVLAPLHRRGETGLVDPPLWLHLPGRGSVLVEVLESDSPVLVRSDAWRPLHMTTLELKLGEEPQPEGDYLLPAGTYRATIEFRIAELDIPLSENAPSEIKQAVERCALTALTYRPDTATFSNNGASMHCPISMDTWADVTTRIGRILPGLDVTDLLRDSLERWLDGGPGYASGRLLVGGELHLAEDEYLMTGTASLLGLATYLTHARPAEWLARYAAPIGRQIEAMRARDLDGDGLIESPYRTGVSGTSQWSTCWFDVISFGWKDAFSNAILYSALKNLSSILPELEQPGLGEDLSDWSDRLRASYVPTFFNPETGWLAGWRCREDRLHDYAFLAVNGAAVCADLLEPDAARSALQNLLEESRRVGLPDAYLGLPGNLWHIPDADLADIMQGYPLGFYQNGGRTHSQSRHFVGGLYRVGLTEEADELLRRLCLGLAHGAVFGGCGSGRDWRYWDGRTSGYEGLLTDQFGIIALALERFGQIRMGDGVTMRSC